MKSTISAFTLTGTAGAEVVSAAVVGDWFGALAPGRPWVMRRYFRASSTFTS